MSQPSELPCTTAEHVEEVSVHASSLAHVTPMGVDWTRAAAD
jgi:hypothetical protein